MDKTKKIKILHFYKTYFPDSLGGIEKTIDQIISSTSEMGVTSEVLTLTNSIEESTIEINGYKVHRVPQICEFASTPFSTRIFKRFNELIQSADIIHYHFPWPFADLLHFVNRVKKPCVLTYHSDIIKQKFLLKAYTPLMNCFLSSISHIIATSPNYLASSKTLPKYANKISIVPIGLNKSLYPDPDPDKLAYWRNQFGGKFFLFIGVMRYYKGLHILVNAAVNIKVPILIIGTGNPIEQELRQQVKKLNLSNVHFLGSISEVDKVALIKLCYAIVSPSHLRSEAFGISLLEGAMYGKPMISSEIGTGTTFINISNDTGLVVPPGDPIKLTQAMQFMLDNQDLTSQMGKKAEERYWKLFTADQMARSYVSIYNNLMPVYTAEENRNLAVVQKA